MKNPNAFAAALTLAITSGVEYLLQRYAHVSLHGYWKNAVDGGLASLVLLVGRDGVGGALSRLLSFLKRGWRGTKPAPVPPAPTPASVNTSA